MANLTVTPEQMKAASRQVDSETHQVYYLVESQSTPGTLYKVAYNRQYRVIQCLPYNGQACPASTKGLTCWHMRAALACEEAHKAAFRAECARIEATRAYEREVIEQDLAEAERRMAELDARDNGTNEAEAHERVAIGRDGAKAYERKPFSLLR